MGQMTVNRGPRGEGLSDVEMCERDAVLQREMEQAMNALRIGQARSVKVRQIVARYLNPSGTHWILIEQQGELVANQPGLIDVVAKPNGVG